MNFSEKWGKDVDEAVKLALMDLKLTIDDVDVIVLEESSKGFFGLGSKLAKVRVEKKSSQAVAKEEPEVERKPEKKEKPQKPEKAQKKDEKPVKEERKKQHEKIEKERPTDLTSVTEHPAIDFLKEVTSKMGLELAITAAKNEECIYVDIEGKDAGTVIGKRGQTLDSIQYLTSLVVNKEKEKYVRVIVDAESYRTKRESTLEQLAERLADKVVRTKKSVKLEPMNPYERKVIHAKLQSNPKITTRSEGEEPYRRVIIEMK